MKKTIQTTCILLVCVAYISFATGSQKLNPTGRDISLTSLLRVSDSVIGETEITITADDEILLPKASTLILLESMLMPSTLEKLGRQGNATLLSQKDFQQVGLDLSFDFSSLESVIAIPSEQMKTQQLSMAEKPPSTAFIAPHAFNGYLNAAVSNSLVQRVGNDESKQSNYHHRFDAGLNYKRLTLEYESTYDDLDGLEGVYARQGTRLNVDFPTYGTRLVLGDMFNTGTLFQDSVDVMGIGIARDFSLIPTRNVRPKASQSFTLTRTSNVDVVVDGAVVQRFTLNAGTYNLNDIPIAQGINDIELVITDASGQEERVSFSVATGNDLLAAGEYEYAFLVGAPTEFRDDELQYDTEQRILSGYVDVGVAPWLTLGINAQKRDSLYQYGGSALVASSLGVTEVIASHSEHPILGRGTAYRIAHDMEIADELSWLTQVSFLYDFTSPNFSGVESLDNNTAPLNSVRHFGSFFASFDVNPALRSAVSLTYSKGDGETNNYWSVSPSVTGALFQTKATWSTRVDYQKYRSGDDEFCTTFTVSWPIGETTRVVSRIQNENNFAGLDISYREGVGNTEGISAFASIERDDDRDANINGSVDYTGNRFQARADHFTRFDSLSEDTRSHNTRLQLSSAVAFSGSKVAVGREVGEAFAIVTKHKSLSDNTVEIDPSTTDGFARVVSDSPANVLIPDLTAYNPQYVSFNVENLPPGYDLGEGVFSVNPGYKQGYQFTIGSDAVITALGVLRFAGSEEPVPLTVGEAVYLDDNQIKPLEFFTNRKGRFAISGMRPGTYRLVLKTNPRKDIDVTIADNGDTLMRLGELYVE
ncbi:fimbria/pilus outer membrane usher protein [Enterovibrio sp. ZSDZ35]|uniref:Fimbria/pilus outer membrane usher protein n=1 Tax=Enterovibrio qingdaonensis TaxID=2899818 RepID=A0ABT5QMN0_9GAMM|nr:fimbria/pilus outer membrane usher protein [Enterovibrio sp. ZSDZ35]MDD1781923.1 fimbria/pilus outer membrane usher protein [Enterovibrio sp. ZSDZ35]